MKKNIYSRISGVLSIRGLFAVAVAMVLVSCGTQMNGYTETDGVYYNPETDVIPEAVAAARGNTIDEVYDYNETGIIEQSKKNEQLKNDRYNVWTQKDDSDWGTYAGTEVDMNYGWDYPYGFYNPWGMNRYSFYSPFGYFGYSPFYDFMYSPFSYYDYSPYYYGYNPYSYYGYSPYGYGSPYYYNSPYYYARPYNYKRSGSEGLRTSPNTSGNYNRPYGTSRSGNVYQPAQTQPARTYRSQPRTETPRYETPRVRNTETNTYRNDGGFRSNSSSENSSTTTSGRRSGGGFR